MHMQQIGDRAAIHIFCVLFMVQQGINGTAVAGMLSAFIISCLGLYLKRKPWIWLGIAVYLALSFVVPGFCFYYPVILYEMLSVSRGSKLLFQYAAAIVVMAICIEFQREAIPLPVILEEVAVTGLAVWLCRNRCQMELLQEQYFQTQDSSTELALELRSENRYLMAKQDSDIYAATLQERNRIAREIHDNVGHMLSRGILMTGALITVAGEETVRLGLKDLKDCLDEAMTSIRQSVHDLHDESIDPEQAIGKLLEDLSGYQVGFEYDMTSVLPREVKYCLIAIAKEAVSNILKHSDGDRVDVSAVEHPAFYKLSVSDNGRCRGRKQGDGIGLQNIRDRVEHLSGTLSVSAEETGFRIHVTIPKK